MDQKPSIELSDEAAHNRQSISKVQDNDTFQFSARDEEARKALDKQVLRKVDARLLPMLIFMYLLNFLDRSNLAQARQGTLEEDLGMESTDFNLATSIFFVGYLLMQLPSNMLITRVRPSLYLGAACAMWGVVSTCNAAVHDFKSLVVVRFFLGFVEAPFFPGKPIMPWRSTNSNLEAC
jgi:MFS transporter, ACS family, DAL5 transporter family protein